MAIQQIGPHPRHTNIKVNSRTFLGEISNKLKRFLTDLIENVPFRTDHTLGDYIKNNTGKTSKFSKYGVFIDSLATVAVKCILLELLEISSFVCLAKVSYDL